MGVPAILDLDLVSRRDACQRRAQRAAGRHRLRVRDRRSPG
jgi:hypothetical protein